MLSHSLESLAVGHLLSKDLSSVSAVGVRVEGAESPRVKMSAGERRDDVSQDNGTGLTRNHGSRLVLSLNIDKNLAFGLTEPLTLPDCALLVVSCIEWGYKQAQCCGQVLGQCL